jgi:hypothetical protein
MFYQAREVKKTEDAHLPLSKGLMYEFLIAGNGTFIHSERPGLKAVIPRDSSTRPDLPPIQPYVRVEKKYRAWMLDEILQVAKAKGNIECLFVLTPESISMPAQEATIGNVRPLDPYDVIMAKAIFELHSHHEMPARFSPTDNKEETGMRLYAVIGRIFTQPEIRVRVGIYGHFWEIPARTVFDLPAGFKDALA